MKRPPISSTRPTCDTNTAELGGGTIAVREVDSRARTRQRVDPVSRLLLLGPAREAVGVGRVEIDGDTVSAVTAAATAKFGASFAAVLAVSRLWVNGEEASADQAVGPSDEIAVVPPVSGG